MKTDNDIIPVEVFAGTQWETSMIKSLLENEDIEVFLKNEIMGTLNPWHTSPGGVNPIKVIVSSQNLSKALQIIKDYQKNLREEK